MMPGHLVRDNGKGIKLFTVVRWHACSSYTHLHYPISDSANLLSTSPHDIDHALAPHGLGICAVFDRCRVFLCISMLKDNAIIKSKRLLRVPSDESRTGWDVVWWYDSSTAMNIFEDETDVIFIYR